MKQTSGNYPETRVHNNQEIEYYMHKARVMRAEYIAGMYKRIGKRILSLFKSDKRTATQAGKVVQV